MSVLAPTVEENPKENEVETQFDTPRARGPPNTSSSSDKENRSPTDDLFEHKPSLTHCRPESACSASKCKSTTMHSQPLDQLRYMESSLSLMTGVPTRTPMRLRAPITETVDKEKAAERASRYSEPSSTNISAKSPVQPPRNLLKPLSPSPPPQPSLRKLGPVAWAKKSLSKHSRSSQESHSISSTQGKPKAKIFRASTRESEQQAPKDQRRLRGSDPGMATKGLDGSPRKFSRSLYDDPQRKKKLLELDYAKRFHKKDPLSTVSQEEDLVSLAELARELDYLEEQDGANSPSQPKSMKQEPPNSSRSKEETAMTPLTSKRSNFNLSKPASQGQNSKPSQRIMNAKENLDNETEYSTGLDPKSQPASAEAIASSPSAPKRSLASGGPVTPRFQPTQQRNTTGSSSFNRPGSPGTKFSALIAKFNNPDSQTSPERSPSRPPKKSLPEFLAGENQKRADSSKQGLVAPYTTNPPSPTKSQRSSKSAITPLSTRSSLISSRKLFFDANLDFSRRPSLAGSAGKDDLQLPSARPIPENVAPFKKTPPTTRSSPLGCPKAPCPLEDPSPTDGAQLNADEECPYVGQKPLEGITALQYDPNPSTGCSTQPDQVMDQVTVCAMQVPTSRKFSLSSKAVTGSPSTEVPTLDGPSGALDLKRLPMTFGTAESELNRTKSSPSLLDKANFVHPESPFKDVFTTSRPISPVESPPIPGRSNSVLYAQIRALQRQLAVKTEEVRQLRKQLDTRASLDIGTLSEQLRQAKKEIQHWRSRAEVAEKQVEMFAKLPLKPKSRQPSVASSTKSTRLLARSSTGYPGESADMAARIRKALHGMDGAESPPRWNSEESSDTVIREPLNGTDQRV